MVPLSSPSHLFLWVEPCRAVAIRSPQATRPGELGDRAAGKTARRASATHDFNDDGRLSIQLYSVREAAKTAFIGVLRRVAA
jgi:hypothetical protein